MCVRPFITLLMPEGLGECQLSLARSLLEDCRDGGAVDLIQHAVVNLFR